MAMLSRGGNPQLAGINITPLIDVLLVLLIIFMVITPSLSVGLTAVAPQLSDPNAAPQRSADLILTVKAGRIVLLNQEAVPLDGLAARLKGAFGNAPNRPVFVRADKDLDFAQVAEVIDIAKGAGLDRIGLLPK